MSTFTKRPDYKSKQNQYDKLLDKQRFQKACLLTDKVKYQLEDIRYYKCIGNFYSDSAVYLMELFYNYERGVLPFHGSLMDQPAKIIDIFQLIDAMIKSKKAEIQKDMEKEASRKARSNGRR